MNHIQPVIDTSPKVSDEIRKTTCYMCACRCGINVHMKEGKVAYIEGNRDHPVNKGVLCAKGSAGIMQVNAPSRLRSPLKRVGERGSGEFEEISWDEALEIASTRLAKFGQMIHLNWHFLLVEISHSHSQVSGRRGLERQTTQLTVAFVR